jgi:hypothetical protein
MRQLQEDLGEDFARQIQEWRRPSKIVFISKLSGIPEGASADEMEKQLKTGMKKQFKTCSQDLMNHCSISG